MNDHDTLSLPTQPVQSYRTRRAQARHVVAIALGWLAFGWLWVRALEEPGALAAAGSAALAGLANVQPVEGPLAEGWRAGAPYDLILIDGAVEFVPDAIVAQLGDGGRLAVALIEDGVTRLAIGRRAGDGFGAIAFADHAAAALPGFRRPRAFVF